MPEQWDEKHFSDLATFLGDVGQEGHLLREQGSKLNQQRLDAVGHALGGLADLLCIHLGNHS